MSRTFRSHTNPPNAAARQAPAGRAADSPFF